MSAFATATRFRPLGGLAAVTAVMLGIAAATSANLSAAFSNRNYALGDLADRARLAGLAEAEEALTMAMRLEVGTVLATGVAFILWQYRFSRNAENLHGPLGLGAGWAIGGWFIPIANLVLPFLQLSHAAKASDPGLQRGASWQAGRVPGVLKAWTSVYIAALVIYVLSSTTSTRSDSVGSSAMLLLAVAGILGLCMVLALTKRQKQAIAGVTHLS